MQGRAATGFMCAGQRVLPAAFCYTRDVNPRHLVIRFVTPLIWRLFPGRKLRAIQRFSVTEKDSGCQLLYCISLTDDPELRTYLFQHVIEELFHAEIFEELCRDESDKHLYIELLPRIGLLPEHPGPAEIADFFAYVHVGEQAVNRDFLVYSRSRFDPALKAVFRRAGLDEGHHEVDTQVIFERLAGGKRAYQVRLARARILRSWRLFAEAMKSVGVVPMTAMLSLIYFLLAPLAVPGARRRLELPEEEQLRLFREQVAEFEASQA